MRKERHALENGACDSYIIGTVSGILTFNVGGPTELCCEAVGKKMTKVSYNFVVERKKTGHRTVRETRIGTTFTTEAGKHNPAYVPRNFETVAASVPQNVHKFFERFNQGPLVRGKPA